jgi:hypothetical protein
MSAQLETVWRRYIVAYLLDRADQYDADSPCWVALCYAAEDIGDGEFETSVLSGELDDNDIMRRARLMCRDGEKRRPDAYARVDHEGKP